MHELVSLTKTRKKFFYSCQIIRDSPGTFKMVRHTVMRPANAGIDLGGAHFQHLL
jgi:hypothetical protein